MKRKLLNICLLSALVFSFAGSAFAQGQGYTTTQVQRNFAEEVKSLPDVIQASWQSPLDLWVYSDGVTKSSAEAVADQVILLAQTNLGQSLCVHIHDGDFEPLATKCWSAL